MSFNISVLLTLAGLILTAYSIYLVLRKKKYPGRLTLVSENSVGLFDEIANNFKEISIQFDGEPIRENIVYIKGSIVNNGEIDLNIGSSEIPLKLSLKDNLKWIKSNITKSSQNVKCDSEISDENDLIFNCGILRINEFFQFEALIETNSEKVNSTNIFNKIKPSHRLLNTQKIETTRFLNKEEREDNSFDIKYFLGICVLTCAFMMSFSLYDTYGSDSAKLKYEKGNELYDVEGQKNGFVIVENIGSGDEKKIKLSQFEKYYKPKIPEVGLWDNVKSGLKSTLVVIIVIFVLSILEIVFTSRKSKQVSKIIDEG